MLLRIEEVCEMFGVGKSQLYEMMKNGFPQPINISKKSHRWLSQEIAEWMKGKMDDR